MLPNGKHTNDKLEQVFVLAKWMSDNSYLVLVVMASIIEEVYRTLIHSFYT